MQQRQPRLGDILDDYCTRERRVTNHAVVAMVGLEVKQTRCTTCDAEHEYKHAKVPRQRRKAGTAAALYSQVLADGPKRVVHEEPVEDRGQAGAQSASEPPPEMATGAPAVQTGSTIDDQSAEAGAIAPSERGPEEGPVHRPLIRATLPRPEGQPPPGRPTPEFTIRQPGGRQNRFRPGRGRGGQAQGIRPGGTMGGQARGGMSRLGGARQPPGPIASRIARRHGHGPKRPK